MSVDLSLLNPEQHEAVCHDGSHLLVIAGPGSGKTRVLTHRVARLLDDGIPAWQILAVTFTNKAAGEIRDRLEKLTDPDSVQRLWAGTFHSLCARLLRFEHEALGLARSFQILDTDDTERVVLNILKDRGLVEDAKQGRQFARELREQISLSKNTFTDPRARLDGDLLAQVMEEYAKRLTEMQALDFDDLLLFALRLLRSDSDVARRWQQRFSYVLVDEFQDTNAVQLALVKAFSTNGTVTAVGDAAQAIYSWRGADHTVIERFATEFPGARVIMLGENYRSTPQIVTTCQAILDGDEDAPYRLELRTGNAHGNPVVARECDDDRDEASWIATKLRSGEFRLDEHAILVRTAAQTRSIEEELISRRIPYVVVGGQKFYERAEVRDALAHLRCGVFDTDVVAFMRAIATPRCGVGEKTAGEIVRRARELGSLQKALLAGTGRGAASLERFATHLENIAQAALESGPAAAVRASIGGGLAAHWASQQGGESRVENLEQLVSAAGAFMKGTTADGRVVATLDAWEATLAFVEHIALVSAADEGGAQGVQILTIHAAKGREFPVVFVAGVEEELLPHIRSIASHAALREERRLFYVACSRAERRLYISWARQRLLFGKPREQQPSRFLADLPQDGRIVERESAVRRKAPWTDNHRSRPVGAGSWSQSFTTPAARPPATPAPIRPAVAAGPRLDPTSATPGTRVEHPSFGVGEIRSVKGDSVEVKFADKSRTLALSMAPLSLAS